MKKRIALIAVLLLIGTCMPAMASESHSGHQDKDKASTMEGHDTAGNHGGEGTFKHEAVVDGVQTQFEIMSLASMNMKAENGATHHVMVKLFDGDGNRIDEVRGKVKLIAPSGKEQTSSLKNYNGVLAANFTFDEQGKYGVICLFKQNETKHLVKFWYPHGGGATLKNKQGGGFLDEPVPGPIAAEKIASIPPIAHYAVIVGVRCRGLLFREEGDAGAVERVVDFKIAANRTRYRYAAGKTLPADRVFQCNGSAE